MYPASLEKILQKKGIRLGDRVAISRKGDRWEGTLMPRPYDRFVWVLKLDNGYNVGVDAKGSGIALVEKKKPSPVAAPTETHRGELAVLGCGGTIASKVEYKTGAVYPAISPEELRASFPQMERIATIHTRQLFSIFSEDMTAWHWQQMGQACAHEIKEGVKGVVLMHGTDTMGYTAAALSFMLQTPVPVVLVGAQRSSDRPSSDNEMNLLNALFAAKQNWAGIGATMHATTNDDFGYLHRGTRVRKMHTSRRDAFQSINAPPLAKVDYRSNRFDVQEEMVPRDRQKLQLHAKINENVALVHAHPGMPAAVLKSLRRCDGVVIAATGLGHVPTNPFGDKHAHSWLPEIRQLVESGIPVAIAPQTLHGRINLNVYTTGRLLKEAGVIGDGADWLPEVALVKLMWVLGQTKSMKKVREIMETNLAGELTTRTPLEW